VTSPFKAALCKHELLVCVVEMDKTIRMEIEASLGSS